MKRLILIFIGIISFFSCFAMEERAITPISQEQQQENEHKKKVYRKALGSVLYQWKTNFANNNLRLHKAVVRYKKVILNESKENISEDIEEIVRQYAKEHGATLDTLAYANHYGLCKLSKILIEYGALNHKLVDNEWDTPTPDEIEVTFNMKSKDGNTVLCDAVASGYENFVETLLMHGADPNVANSHQVTPLMMATTKPSLTSVKLLLEFNADVDKRDENGRTALHYASYTNKVNVKEKKQLEYEAIVYELIKHGASMSAKTMQGETPLEYAIGALRENIVEILLKLNVLSCLSAGDKERILNHVQASLQRVQVSRDNFAQSMQEGSDVIEGYSVSNLIKEENRKIRIFKRVLMYDEEKGAEREHKENTVQSFMLKKYKKDFARNCAFPKIPEDPEKAGKEWPGKPIVGMASMIRDAEIHGNRGIKRGGLKRLCSADESEEISWIINYPIIEEQPDVQGEDDGQDLEPKKKKQRTK